VLLSICLFFLFIVLSPHLHTNINQRYQFLSAQTYWHYFIWVIPDVSCSQGKKRILFSICDHCHHCCSAAFTANASHRFSINHANRWLEIPVINLTFQTSDFAKIALIMYVARTLSVKQDVIKISAQRFCQSSFRYWWFAVWSFRQIFLPRQFFFWPVWSWCS